MAKWIIAAALILGGQPALAGEPPPDKDLTVQLAPVALPVVVDGQLINYVFVTVKLNLAPTADGAFVRTKEPFFRDALVRAGHRAPFTVATDYTRVDEKRIRAEVMSDATAFVGRGKIKSVEIIKQVSQHHSDLPSPHSATRRPELIP